MLLEVLPWDLLMRAAVWLGARDLGRLACVARGISKRLAGEGNLWRAIFARTFPCRSALSEGPNWQGLMRLNCEMTLHHPFDHAWLRVTAGELQLPIAYIASADPAALLRELLSLLSPDYQSDGEDTICMQRHAFGAGWEMMLILHRGKLVHAICGDSATRSWHAASAPPRTMRELRLPVVTAVLLSRWRSQEGASVREAVVRHGPCVTMKIVVPQLTQRESLKWTAPASRVPAGSDARERCSGGSGYFVRVRADASMDEFRQLLERQTGVPQQQQRLFVVISLASDTPWSSAGSGVDRVRAEFGGQGAAGKKIEIERRVRAWAAWAGVGVGEFGLLPGRTVRDMGGVSGMTLVVVDTHAIFNDPCLGCSGAAGVVGAAAGGEDRVGSGAERSEETHGEGIGRSDSGREGSLVEVLWDSTDNEVESRRVLQHAAGVWSWSFWSSEKTKSLLAFTVWGNTPGTLDFSIGVEVMASDSMTRVQEHVLRHWSWSDLGNAPGVRGGHCLDWAGGCGGQGALAWEEPGERARRRLLEPIDGEEEDQGGAEMALAVRMYLHGRQLMKDDVIGAVGLQPGDCIYFELPSPPRADVLPSPWAMAPTMSDVFFIDSDDRLQGLTDERLRIDFRSSSSSSASSSATTSRECSPSPCTSTLTAGLAAAGRENAKRRTLAEEEVDQSGAEGESTSSEGESEKASDAAPALDGTTASAPSTALSKPPIAWPLPGPNDTMGRAIHMHALEALHRPSIECLFRLVSPCLIPEYPFSSQAMRHASEEMRGGKGVQSGESAIEEERNESNWRGCVPMWRWKEAQTEVLSRRTCVSKKWLVDVSSFGAVDPPRQIEYSPHCPGVLAVGSFSGDVAISRFHDSAPAHRTVGNVEGTVRDGGQRDAGWRLGTPEGQNDADDDAEDANEQAAPDLNDKGPVVALQWLRHRSELLFAANTRSNGRSTITVLKWDGDIGLTLLSSDPMDLPFLNSMSVNATDELMLFAGGEMVSVVDMSTGVRVLTNRWHSALVNSPSFANEHPAMFATASLDGQAALWDVRMGMQRPAWRRALTWGGLMAQWSSRDDRLLVAGCDNRVVQLASTDGCVRNELELEPISDSANYTKAAYTACGSFVASVSRLEDELRLSCACSGELVAAYRVRDKRPFESLNSFTRICRPDPFHPYRFAVVVDGPRAVGANQDSACAYAIDLPLATPWKG